VEGRNFAIEYRGARGSASSSCWPTIALNRIPLQRCQVRVETPSKKKFSEFCGNACGAATRLEAPRTEGLNPPLRLACEALLARGPGRVMRLAECATIGSDESEFWMVAHALDVIDLSRHEAATRFAASRIYSKEGAPKFPPILV